MPPETVGNRRKVMVSDQGGKANFIAELKRRGIEVPKDDHRLDTLISLVKEREAEGYAYEGADASFELLARRIAARPCRSSSTSPRSAAWSSAASTPTAS